MMNSAGPEDFPHVVASGPAACLARFEDCRCVWEDEHVQLHMCVMPGCGALWTQSNAIVRLPGKQDLPRRYDRADLRAA